MPTKVIMPQLGESVVEGTVAKWLKKVGDPVKEYEPILEVSTDKVDTEIPAPANGVLLQIYVPEGQTVERGVLLAMIGQPGEAVPEAPSTVGSSVLDTSAGDRGHRAAEPGNHAAPSAHDQDERSQRYSPVVARMAAEHKIDLTQIKGTGLGGRVTKKDVEAYLESQGGTAQPAAQELAPWEQPISGDLFKPTDEVFAKASGKKPESAPSNAPVSHPSPAQPARITAVPVQPVAVPQDQPGELVPFSPMRRLIAEHMVRSKLHTAPHVTTVFEVDMSRVMAHWQGNMDAYAKQGIKLTLTAYFVMAIVKAVQAQPTLNSQWTDQGLFVHQAINVGMAVALSEGLIVPVIRNAQDLSLAGIAKQVSDLASRARSKALRPDEITGGTITLTNHGVSGSLFATPIINQPQSAIIGTGAVKKRVVVIDETDSIAIRPMMYVTLTFDHRVADGAMGDAFLATFKRTLENWQD
jgi:pyruvate/2-oxoglutarate dehydrogenase complex dihydrolipoamide acyltransferase (E2) component